MIQITREYRKTLTLKIDEAYTIQVKAPMALSEEEILKFIQDNEAWIEEAIADQKIQNDAKAWFEKKKLVVLGQSRDIIIKNTQVDYTTISLEESALLVVTGLNEPQRIKQEIEIYLKEMFMELLKNLSDEYAKKLGCSYAKITVRKQKTRWGSCSRKGNLSYNMNLIGAPIEVIRYVVLHEVVHLKHFGHQANFWEEMSRWMPDYKAYDKYLKVHYKELQI